MADFSLVESIFFAAQEKRSSEERAAFLQQACGDDPELRRVVERLLAAQPQVGSFLAAPAGADVDETLSPVPELPSPVAPPMTEQPGQVIAGKYTLVQKLGEGGMGSVWVAEQIHPVKRRVALKMIRAGLGSDAVLRRFDAERQALAVMDHPNIAKILDGGSVEMRSAECGVRNEKQSSIPHSALRTPHLEGRPFFVMELVKGVPITRYCDELQLSIRDRLQLFGPVCQAIQHAHQKGVIHRDIKPGNVLVAIRDGVPVPKVIDFGVAKALNQRLTDQTMNTEIGAVIGTLEYMSPEQAELSVLDIDTRADVYALGVLLYELLTGTTPINRAQLKDAAIFEMLRMIKQDEPPKPSTRLTESKESLAGLAAQRRTEPGKLTKEVRGELDWIVMKCLEKDRTRRYESASGLAKDVERYLADDAVEAGPPSARYRLRKFTRKHRALLATATAFVLLLLTGTAVSGCQAIRAQQARHRAEHEAAAAREAQLVAERAQKAESLERDKAIRQAKITEAVKEFLERDLIAQADAMEAGLLRDKPDPDLKLKSAIDRAAANIPQRFAGQPLIEASVRRAIGNAYRGRGLYPEAQPHLERAGELYRGELARGVAEREVAHEYFEVLMELGDLYIDQGQVQKAVAMFRAGESELRRLGGDDPEVRGVLDSMAAMTKALAANNDAQAVDFAKEILRRVGGPVGREPNAARESPELKAANDAVRAASGDMAKVLDAVKLISEGKFSDAERALKQQIDERQKQGEPGADTLVLSAALADVYCRQGKLTEAHATFTTARAGLKKILGDDHPAVAACELGLGQVRLAEKQFDQAEGHFRATLTVFRKQMADHYVRFQAESLLGAALAGQKKYADAEPLLLAGYDGMKSRLANIPKHDQALLIEARERLAQLYDAWGKPAEAAKWRKEPVAAEHSSSKSPAKP